MNNIKKSKRYAITPNVLNHTIPKFKSLVLPIAPKKGEFISCSAKGEKRVSVDKFGAGVEKESQGSFWKLYDGSVERIQLDSSLSFCGQDKNETWIGFGWDSIRLIGK